MNTEDLLSNFIGLFYYQAKVHSDLREDASGIKIQHESLRT